MNVKFLILDLAIAFLIYLLVIMISRVLYPLQHSFSKDYKSFVLSYKQLPKYLLQYERVDGKMYIGHLALLVLLPSILMAIAAAVCQSMGYFHFLKTFYLIIPLFWIIRELIIQLDHSRIYFDNRLDLLELIFSNALGILIYFFIRKLISKSESILMSITELRDAIWFAIIVYVGKILWDYLQIAKDKSDVRNATCYLPAIETIFEKFKKKYGSFIDSELKRNVYENDKDKNDIKRIIYSIMIFEDYNRPASVRIIEYIVKIIIPFKPRTMGIMQFKSDRLITNKQSIRLAIKKISASYKPSDEYDSVESAIRQYNVGDFYYNQVSDIYDSLLAIEDNKNRKNT